MNRPARIALGPAACSYVLVSDEMPDEGKAITRWEPRHPQPEVSSQSWSLTSLVARIQGRRIP